MIRDAQLSTELEELFDIRSAKLRNEKNLNLEAMAAQRDIRLLTHMFREGIPDISLPMGENESIKWDSHKRCLIISSGDEEHLVEATSKETMIRVRPYLSQLVKVAKQIYSD